MIRALLLPCFALPVLAGEPLWWTQLLQGRALSAAFVQESDSAVFGKTQRTGRLQTAPGGRLRVAYDGGLLFISDGRRIIQYDPDTRSAQRMELQRAIREAPMLALLAAPAELRRHFTITFQGEAVQLVPRSKDLPSIRCEGKGPFPQRFAWTDSTGAAQELRLTSPSATVDPSAFHFVAPAGTRWSE